MRSNIKKGETVLFKGNQVYVVFCSINRVMIRLNNGSEQMVSYHQLSKINKI